jgi:hypothetical protein
VLAACHDIFTLLVFSRNHFKLDGCVTHSMVSLRENKDKVASTEEVYMEDFWGGLLWESPLVL